MVSQVTWLTSGIIHTCVAVKCANKAFQTRLILIIPDKRTWWVTSVLPVHVILIVRVQTYTQFHIKHYYVDVPQSWNSWTHQFIQCIVLNHVVKYIASLIKIKPLNTVKETAFVYFVTKTVVKKGRLVTCFLIILEQCCLALQLGIIVHQHRKVNMCNFLSSRGIWSDFDFVKTLIYHWSLESDWKLLINRVTDSIAFNERLNSISKGCIGRVSH